MEVDRTDSASSAACRRSGSAVARYAGCTQWHFMGVGHGSSVARTASEISTIPGLPPPLSALGASAQAGARFAGACGRVTSARKTDLEEAFIDTTFAGAKKGARVGDKAYDSDRLDCALAERYDIEMIAPHRGVRRKPTQDGRPLRRYCRRWRVERLFAWLHHFRPR